MSSFTASIHLLFGLPPSFHFQPQYPSTQKVTVLPTYISVSKTSQLHCPSKRLIIDHVSLVTPQSEVQHLMLLSALPWVFYLSLNHTTLILSQCFIHFSFHYDWYSFIPHYSDSFLWLFSQTACTCYFTFFPHFGQWQPNSCFCAGLSIFSKLHFSMKHSF